MRMKCKVGSSDTLQGAGWVGQGKKEWKTTQKKKVKIKVFINNALSFFFKEILAHSHTY